MLTLATREEVELDSTRGSERLAFIVDPSIEDTSHASGTIRVAGETGYVLQRGPTPDGLYREIVIVRHAGVQYEAACTGFRGYDSARLTSGCDAFIGSLRFRA